MYNEETGMYEGYIYQIYNPFNMKSYIGQTIRSIDERIKEHIKRAKNHTSDSPILYQDIKDYGFDKFNVYEVECISVPTLGELRDRLNEKEIYYIEYYNSLKPNGYNISPGGHEYGTSRTIYQFDEFGQMICEYESTEDISCKTGFKTNVILRCCREEKGMAYGYFWSYSPILSDSYFNYRKPKTKTVMYDLSGHLVKIFDSIREAALEVVGDKLKWHYIYDCMAKTEHCKTAYGHIWRYYKDVVDEFGNVLNVLPLDEVIEATTMKIPDRGRKICQFSKSGKYIKTYRKISLASKETGIRSTLITNCLNGRQKTAGGYIWKDYNDIMKILSDIWGIVMTDNNDSVKEFVVNDLSIATFLEGHGSRMIDCRGGKYVFIYDDTIDKNLELYMEVKDKCMF